MEAEHLPEGVEAEAARHHRVALEMAGEEPEVGPDIELGPSRGPCRGRRPSAAIDVMRSNISIGGSGSCALPGPEEFAAPAGQKVLVGDTATGGSRPARVSRRLAALRWLFPQDRCERSRSRAACSPFGGARVSTGRRAFKAIATASPGVQALGLRLAGHVSIY